MKRLFVFIACVLLTGSTLLAGPVFRMHLFGEPSSLSPFLQKTTGSAYFLTQLYCPLLKWDNFKTLPAGGDCHFQDQKKVVCKINSELKFQNGEKVTAEHYRQSFAAFLDPLHPWARAEILFSIRNAKAVVLGQKSPDLLGVHVQKDKLIFELEKPDADFLLTLANPLLTAVWKTEVPSLADFSKFQSCGPYQIQEWKTGHEILLKPNPYFLVKNDKRPLLKFVFVTEDSLALQYYQKNELDFLRRLPTLYFEKWEKSPELFKISQVRLDYLALSPAFRDENLARALAQSIDFTAWQKLYHADPRPGCFGIPDRWTNGQVCWEFDVKQAQKAFSLVKNKEKIKDLRFFYSKQGGDDHERGVEFLQSQWRKNLGIEIPIEGMENKIFLGKLKNKELPFFRKGLWPERDSCLAVLENFGKNSNENYPQVDSDLFESVLLKLQTANSTQAIDLCRKGVEILRDKYFFIPTGPLFFSLLVKPGWQGWTLNELNTLDLSNLVFTGN